MSDLTIGSRTYLQREKNPALPPPRLTSGPLAWVRQNLFSSIGSSVLTFLFLALALWIIPSLIDFAFVKAVWSGDAATCRANLDGACWAFIRDKFDYLRYGSYPIDQRWRVDVTEVVGAVLIFWLLWNGAPPAQRRGTSFLHRLPGSRLRAVAWSAADRLAGDRHEPVGRRAHHAAHVRHRHRVLAAARRVAGARAPLAACRSSRPPASTFIEFVRGVPFITVLFMANFMLPLFLPDYLAPDRLLRPHDRHRAVLGRLYGGSGPRRPAGHAEGPVSKAQWRWASAIGR